MTALAVIMGVVFVLNQIGRSVPPPTPFAAGVQAVSAGQVVQAPDVAATDVAPAAAALNVTIVPVEHAPAVTAPTPTRAAANEDITSYSPGGVGSWWTYSGQANGQLWVFRLDVTDHKPWYSHTIVETVATEGNIPFFTSYDAWIDGVLTHHSDSSTVGTYAFTPPLIALRGPLVAGATWQWEGAIVLGGPIVARESTCGGRSRDVADPGWHIRYGSCAYNGLSAGPWAVYRG